MRRADSGGRVRRSDSTGAGVRRSDSTDAGVQDSDSTGGGVQRRGTSEGDLEVWQLVRRRVFLPVSALFVLLSVVCVAGLEIPELVQLLPFAVGLVFLGLPHGALDHLVPARLAGRPATWRTIAPVVALYGALGALVLGLWWAAPAVAFVFFIGLTWFHWGQGDLFAATRRRGSAGGGSARTSTDGGTASASTASGTPFESAARRPLRRAADAATLVLRGALPMVVPLVAFPQTYLATAAGATGLFDPAGATPADAAASWTLVAVSVLTSDAGRIGVAILLGAGVIGTIILNRVSATREPVTGSPVTPVDGSASASQLREVGLRAWRAETVETLVLVLFFSTVPPVLAIGLYFCLWHSLRHVVRLCLLDDRLRAPLTEGRFGVAFARFTQQAAPITLIALALLVGLFALVPRAGTDPSSLLGLYLVLISALTLPHVVIVAFMDRAQRGQAGVAVSGMIGQAERSR